MIVVDSSVWIDCFNGTATRETDFLDSLLGREPVTIGDLLLTEVLQGFRSDSDYEQAKSLLTGLPVMAMLGQELAM
jgi:predicted nucleic acid-binding protein